MGLRGHYIYEVIIYDLNSYLLCEVPANTVILYHLYLPEGLNTVLHSSSLVPILQDTTNVDLVFLNYSLVK